MLRPLAKALPLLFTFFAVVQAPAAVAQSEKELQKLERSLVSKREQQQQNSTRLKQLNKQLSEAEKNLERVETQMLRVFDLAEKDASAENVKAATDTAVLYNRANDRVQTLVSERDQLKAVEAKLAVELPVLDQQYRSMMANYRSGAKTTVKKSSASKASKAMVSGQWPYLNEGSQEQIQWASSRLAGLVGQKALGNQGKAPLKKVELVAKESFGKVEMDYLGDKLYTVKVKVKAGHQLFELFNKEHWHSIPKEDDGELYRFVFDVNSLSQPKLFVFKEALIEE
ncbi:hypothetical protein [Agaribacterium haliotis]|uniref:hypothetical protein n=1 Tax=Agaribacterium haliotis TaxID=2013869 RepID=UPI000BB5954A|nr:hypothetical protein [Agaribacterium haliotis]